MGELRMDRRRWLESMSLTAAHGALALAGCPPPTRPADLRTASGLPLALPGEPAFEASYRAASARHHGIRPAALLLARSREDVAGAIVHAAKTGMPLHLRSGGHCFEDLNTGPGLLVDTTPLDRIEIDAASETAWLGAGVRTGAAIDALHRMGFVLPTGSCPSVGITGLTLGGGFGLLSRQLGLTCDSLLALELVLADGRLVTASATEHPDLFWACRGAGGGQFGAVTRLRFRVHRLAALTSIGLAFVPGSHAAALRAWQKHALSADDRLTLVFRLERFPDGSTRVRSSGFFAGARSDAEAVLAPLLRDATPLLERVAVEESSVPAAQGTDPRAVPSLFKSKSHFFPGPLDDRAVDLLFERFEFPRAGRFLLIFDPYGGAIARVKADATAFARRGVAMGLQYKTEWTRPEEAADSIATVGRLHAAMAPYASGSYVNYPDVALPDWASAYHGGNLDRLRAVRARYDPGRTFRHALAV